MDTAQAWSTGRPIFSRLPDCYKNENSSVADWLTSFFDDLLISTKDKVDDIPRQLDPSLCDSNWLDFLAPLCGFYGQYWDKYWNDNHKRNLLINSYKKIWSNKGSKSCLSTVLTCFEIPHAILSKGDFVLGSSKLSLDELGKTPWEYTIYLNSFYTSTPTADLVRKLNKLFGPCWCKSNIQFDDLIVQNYLDLNDSELLLLLLM